MSLVSNPKWFRDWAAKRKLKIDIDPCGDPWVLGMYGHLSPYHTKSNKKMVCVSLERKGSATEKRKLLKAKPDLILCECDFELLVAVDAKNGKYLTKAINILKIPKLRVVSEDELKSRKEWAKKMTKAKEAKLGGTKD